MCVERDPNDDSPILFKPVVLSEVLLPTGHTYRFTYTIYGEIDRVYLPTGGTESFTYAQVSTLSYTTSPYNQTNRGVIERKASVGGGAAESGWAYGVTSSNPYTVRATAPDGTYGERLLHRSRYTGVGDNFARFGFDDARMGMAYEERAFNSSNVMLRRSLSKWVEAGPTSGGYSRAARDPKVTKQVSILLDAEGTNALWSAAVSRYEQASQPLNQTSATQYGYDSSMSKSAAQTAAVDSFITSDTLAVRTAETTYLDDPAYSARGLTALPISAAVKAGTPSGVVVSRAETRYDESSSFPLLGCGATIGRNDSGETARGNVTTARSWLDPGNTWVETHAQYDACGNVKKAWDAKDTALLNPSRTDYSSAYQFAYPTTMTSPVPDSSGQYGSAVALVTTTAYDLSTGRVTSTTDNSNQATTTFHYTDESGAPDNLNRLRKVVRPGGLQTGGGGQTVYSYGETPGDLHVRTRTYIEAARFTDSYQYFDGLGRTFRLLTYENQNPAKPWITADTEYDTSGRVKRASLPYRAAAGIAMFSTDKWTEPEYDALGRVRTVTTKPDTAAVKTDYSGDRVLVTDQAGKQRISRTDALGRLAEVWEVRSSDPDSGTEAVSFPSRVGVPAVAAGYRTGYGYDVLGNLRTVNQGAQSRYFMYDSLGRLIRARNPEQAAGAAASNITDPVTGHTQWSMAYGYDANGNLTTRVDARDFATTYTYDALNRNTTVDYSNTGTGVDVERYYDGATMGKGRLWTTYAGGPAATATEATAVDAYDAAGRPLAERQLFKANGAWRTYSVQHTYDLAGNVKTQTYPSGRTVAYAYDAAGRPGDSGGQPAFKGNLGDGVERTYASEIRYSQLGGREQERFGTTTPLYNKRFYNVAGQMSNVRLSTYSINTPGQDGNWNRGAIVNHYSDQSWAGSGTDNNGNLRKQELYIPHDDAISASTQIAQHYEYDELNRLRSVTENLNNQTQSFKQSYAYDRFGNRTIDQTTTTNVNRKLFAVDAATNRLGVPLGQAGVMSYDAAGNLTNDTYTQGTGGTRSYDAENRMTAAQFFNGQLQTALYTYDADGRRVRRKIGVGGEVWQVYGMGGELLAEYAATAAPSSPQKEYGYRAGELLITAEPSTSSAPPATPPAGVVPDFSHAQNPGGTWAYGYKASPSSAFTPLSSNTQLFGSGVDTWSRAGATPFVARNNTGATHSYPNAPSVVQPADVLNLHPGSAGERAVVRWTAPASGTYTIEGRFLGLDTGGTTSDVSVAHNTTAVFGANVNGYGNQAAFSLTRTVAAGDALEFSVGFGSNGTYSSDSTGLAATITASGGGQSPTGEAAHWRFDENAWANASDSSGGGHTGTLAGAGWGAGRDGTSAVSFDGVDDYMQVGGSNTLKMTGQVTMSAWVYPTGAGSGGADGGIILNREGEYEIARFADGTIQWAFANTAPGFAWVSTAPSPRSISGRTSRSLMIREWSRLMLTARSSTPTTARARSATPSPRRTTCASRAAVGVAQLPWAH